MKATARACANQGLIKYWGKTEESGRLPSNDSISVCLDRLTTTTTVEFSPEYAHDTVRINGAPAGDHRVTRHLDLVRAMAKSTLKARVDSQNGFPAAVGFASSASGFAALSLAAASAIGLNLSQVELTRLARRGSGSASRSIPGGFSELKAGNDEEAVAIQLASPESVDLRTVVVVVGEAPKKTPSSEGMRITTETSPMFRARLEYLPKALDDMRAALRSGDPAEVARLAEVDTLNMHATMLTSQPSLIYWTAETVAVMHDVRAMREDGIPAYFSIDAGQNPFVNVPAPHAEAARRRLEQLPVVRSTFLCAPGGPTELVDPPLF
ncbi:MAG: diphosphomevalonate decarboxylase [Thermoplasmata archaeon]|nr:diphosphomevalonate decarboxylase [Thermoplasmata archaeon]